MSLSLSSSMRLMLTRRVGEFWLAWATSLLFGMIWVGYVFFNSPSGHHSLNRVIVTLGGTVFTVALVDAVVLLVAARPIENFLTRKDVRDLPAALGYLALLAVAGLTIGALGFMAGYNSGGFVGLLVGTALVVSAPVAFATRLVYPRLKTRPAAAGVIILIASILTLFGLISLLLQPVLR